MLASLIVDWRSMIRNSATDYTIVDSFEDHNKIRRITMHKNKIDGITLLPFLVFNFLNFVTYGRLLSLPAKRVPGETPT